MTLTLCLAVAATLALPTDPPMQVTGHVVRPATIPATDQRIASLKVADGFKVAVFAKDLGKPRMLAIADDGALYITRRGKTSEGGGDVLLLRDADNDGRADGGAVTATKLDHAHGIALRPGTREVYIATINELYRFTRSEDGTFTGKTLVAKNLPDAGQHPNRTIAFRPGDSRTLYMSIGSTCNSCMEGNPLAATMTTLLLPDPGAPIKDDQLKPELFAKGLRNTIGFAWHPTTGEFWGMDHGIDWLGDDEQGEELNLLERGADYGWPVAYEANKINGTLPDKLPSGMTKQEYASKCTPSTLLTTAHAAPMQMAFPPAPTPGAMGEAVKNDAFLALHGSWNRKPPSGYSVVRIRFDAAGKPTAFDPFITGWLTESEGKPAVFGRPCGLTFAKDGAMLISDDENGVIYRVAR